MRGAGIQSLGLGLGFRVGLGSSMCPVARRAKTQIQSLSPLKAPKPSPNLWKITLPRPVKATRDGIPAGRRPPGRPSGALRRHANPWRCQAFCLHRLVYGYIALLRVIGAIRVSKLRVVRLVVFQVLGFRAFQFRG